MILAVNYVASISAAVAMYEIVVYLPSVDVGDLFVFVAFAYAMTFVFWVWQITDAYRLAERYNRAMSQSGRPPW